MGTSPRSMSRSLTTSSISRNDMSGPIPGASYSTMRPGLLGAGWRQIRSLRFKVDPSHESLITPLRKMHVLKLQRLLLQLGRPIRALVFPGRDVGKLFIVPERLAVFGLVLLPEMAAAGLLPV